MGVKEKQLIHTQPLEEFFVEQVRSAITKERILASQHTEYYLVRVLLEFFQRASLFPQRENEEIPLAVLYLQSVDAGRMERVKLLKQLADVALFLAGYFQESLQRKLVDLDYYIAMGGSAYHRLGSLSEETGAHDVFSETFADLSKNFTRYMDVLTEVRETSQKIKDSDLLRLYEKWLTTGSKRLARKLSEFGIHPHLFPKKEDLQ